jgi:hypothetical protein
VNPYRDNQKLGELVGDYRANRGSWLAAAVLSAAASAGLAVYVANAGDRTSMQTVVGVVVMASLALWAAREWYRLGKLELQIYERGLVCRDRGTQCELGFDEVLDAEAQYVPGVRGRGSDDEGNLVAVVLRSPRGTVTLPKELRGFRDLIALLDKRITAPWRKTVIAGLAQRG